MNINLNIERLVLDGVPLNRFEAEQMKGAVEAELGQLLSEGALAPHLLNGGSFPKLNVGSLEGALNQPQNLGQQIAQVVYSGLGTPNGKNGGNDA